jgi:isoquinoline 1-oxidoreductase beta subunit
LRRFGAGIRVEASQLTDGTHRGVWRGAVFLTFLVAAPVLTVAARVGAEILAPARADAVVPSPPQPADVADFGDVMTALTRADTDLFVLQVTAENRIRFEVPRAEVGQGITTALAMIVAEELDARLADVDVPLSDARQDLGCGAVDRWLDLGAQPVGSGASARGGGPGAAGDRGGAGVERAGDHAEHP